MRITLTAIDKIREPFIREGCDLLQKRLASYFSLATVVIRPGSGSARSRFEAEAILRVTGDAAYFWAVDQSAGPLSPLEQRR